MNLESYPLIVSEDVQEFEFISIGPNGKIRKIIRYQKLEGYAHFYNLFFGDWIEKANRLSDLNKSDNGDTNKILGTVALSVIEFMAKHPNAVVLARGSTPSRTRLYQAGINRHWGEISKLFDVEGYASGKWTRFEKGKNYEAFLLFRRQNL